MPRPNANLNKRAEHWVQNALAERTLSEYVPFLTVRTVPSCGKSHRIWSSTSQRIHHLLSNLEAAVFYLADYSPSVTDIREQYPLLPVDETEEIAEQLGVRHPMYKGKLHVMTTDFLLTRQVSDGQPISVKYANELEKLRVLEKSEIERIYWKRRGLTLRFATERDVPAPMAAAIRWVQPYQNAEGIQTGRRTLSEILAALDEALADRPCLSLAAIGLNTDKRLALEPGTSLTVARHGIARGRWRLDLRYGLDPLTPLVWLEAAK